MNHRDTESTENGNGEVLERLMNHRDTESTENGNGEGFEEGTKEVLYDRMVQHWVRQGWRVPMDAAEFYAGLDKRFEERGGMYFIREERHSD